VRASKVHPDSDELIETDTGLVCSAAFRYLTARKLELASRTLTPLSGMAIMVDGDAANRRRVGALLRATVRQADSIGALGGQFVGVLLDDTTETGGVWAAERVRSALAGLAVALRPTASFGVACYPTHALDGASLWTAAGRAALSGRRLGKNRIEVARIGEPAPDEL
jgi:hypothetical protein